jgi:crotonobetainyl-CoA:carnitine CoA-transferase CaiB-like acyl-CoA transferase
MDHGAAYYMAIAILAALHHRERTGEGQWVDLASTSAGIATLPAEVLDRAVNGRPARRAGQPSGNRASFDEMAPHGIYAAQGHDRWLALACRDDEDWKSLASTIDEEWAHDERFRTLAGRLEHQDELDADLGRWIGARDADEAAAGVVAAGVPASVVKSPPERIDADAELEAWGLFPHVDHAEMGRVRVEGLPLHLSEDDWTVSQPAPLLGEHNDRVFGGILGRSVAELDQLRADGVI